MADIPMVGWTLFLRTYIQGPCTDIDKCFGGGGGGGIKGNGWVVEEDMDRKQEWKLNLKVNPTETKN